MTQPPLPQLHTRWLAGLAALCLATAGTAADPPKAGPRFTVVLKPERKCTTVGLPPGEDRHPPEDAIKWLTGHSFAPEWVVVPPVVAGDQYVYAPADFPELLCLNVADGKKAWGAKKGDGLYPAVVGERVLVVGEKTVRCLSLKDGSEQWKADLPGLPCGRAAVLGDTYLVPVSEPETWKGLIAVVDLKAGKVAEVLRPEKDEPVGNLVVHQDVLISQTLTELAVFPIRKKE